jgi:hypothetical protein
MQCSLVQNRPMAMDFKGDKNPQRAFCQMGSKAADPMP